MEYCLPRELTLTIFSYLGPKELAVVQAVNKSWREIALLPVFWKHFCLESNMRCGKECNYRKEFERWTRLNWKRAEPLKGPVRPFHGVFIKKVSRDQFVVCDCRFGSVWNLKTGHEERRLYLSNYAKQQYIYDIIRLGKSRLAYCTKEGIGIWNLKKKNVRSNYYSEDKDQSISCLAKMGKNLLLAGGKEGAVKLWKYKKFTCEREYKGHSSFVFMIKKFGKEQFLTASLKHTVKLWDLNSTVSVRSFPHDPPSLIAWTQLSHSEFATGGNKGGIKIWDIRNSNCVLSSGEKDSKIWSLLTVSNKQIISGSGRGLIKLWDLRNQKTRVFQPDKQGIQCLYWRSKHQFLSFNSAGTVRTWTLQD